MTIRENINYLRRDLLRILVLLWKADRRMALINLALQFVQALLPVTTLYFIKRLIEALVKGNIQFYQIVPLLVGFGLIQFLLALATQYSSYISIVHQQTLSDYLSGEVLNKAVDVDYPYYENPTYHDTLHLAQQQSLFKATLILSNFNALLVNSLTLMFLVGFFFSMHSLFALLFMLFSIPLALIKWTSGLALVRVEGRSAPLEREAAYLYQTLTGVSFAKEVRVFGFGRSFIDKFNKIRRYIHNEKKKVHLKTTIYSLLAESLEIIAMLVIFGLLAKYTLEKAISIGVFVIYIQGYQRLQSTSKGFLQAMVQLFQQRIFLKDLFAFLDIRFNYAQSGSRPFPEGEAGLRMQNLSFTYPETSREVLHNVSINCAPGKVIAIVGENGSGKSTLVKLLARLYTLQEGSITINGENTADILMEEFRQNTIFLFQDFEKYFLTIAENIALGEEKQEMHQPEIERAAVLAGAHDFIMKLSQGYQTRMGRLFKGSEQISGGQWQKLALARIFYKQSKLVVLDEPTSALDATAEFELFKNVKDELQDHIIILITHRLYNLKIADYVYVMEDGRIAEEGSFDELVNKNGAFRRMYDAQKL